MKKKIVFLPYDMDTAIGITNEGILAFSYNLEDTDHLESGADIFNGQESVLWNNLRKCFPEELKAMYQTLRSQGTISYDVVERMFEEHQAKWPEAVFNEDAVCKYIDPLVDDGTSAYLPMLQGSKAEQRKWWLYNRFRYLDSKYNAGDALSDVIQLRGYARADITVTPYADIYPAVKYGSYLVTTRGQRNKAVTLECPMDNVNDTEIYIYSASQLASVGDLSGLKVGFADFSKAVKIQSLKIGDGSDTYSNGNLTELDLGNNTLLKSIDVRNCPSLTQAVDLSGCVNIEEAYFDGTSVTGLSLPDGGILKTLHLPATVANLTIQNQPSLTDLSVASFDNVTTLRLENIPRVDTKEILKSIPASARARLTGFTWECADADEITSLMDVLDTMRGLDENGGNLNKAQVSGTIHTQTLMGSDIAGFNSRYPMINIKADQTTSYLYYYNYDGSELLYTETVLNGGTGGTYTEKPSRASTAANTFKFVGWSTTPNSTTADKDYAKAVVADRKVYAAYEIEGQVYNVYFYNGSTLLYTATDVPYGGSIEYVGDTPVSPDGSVEDYPFEGWSPLPENIQKNTKCYAVFGSPLEVAEISDSWDEIIASVADGTYAERYNPGNYKPLDLGDEGIVNMQIVAMDKEPLADGSGKAPLSWLSMELLKTDHIMNPQMVKIYDYKEGDGWKEYSNAGSTDYFYVSSNGELLKAGEVATWTCVFTAVCDFSMTVSTSLTMYGDCIVGDYEATEMVNGTSVSSKVPVTVSEGELVTIELSFKQDSGVVPPYYVSTHSKIKFLDSSGEKTTFEAVTGGTDKVNITISKNQIAYLKACEEGTGAIGGWEKSSMRSYLKETVKPLIPENVRSAIHSVIKNQDAYNTAGNWYTQKTSDDVWIPSYSELYGSSSLYKVVFENKTANLVKNKSGNTSAEEWWLRTGVRESCFYEVMSNGDHSWTISNHSYATALGFCM